MQTEQIFQILQKSEVAEHLKITKGAVSLWGEYVPRKHRQKLRELAKQRVKQLRQVNKEIKRGMAAHG